MPPVLMVSLLAQDADDDGTTCRVCRIGVEGPDDPPLFTPCDCSGSVGNVHQECLTQWLDHSGKVGEHRATTAV